VIESRLVEAQRKATINTLGSREVVMSGRDGAQFEEFVVARTPALLRLAYVLSGDAALAEDLVQEALIKAHAHWSRISVMEGPDPYVRRMISNEYVNWRRRRRAGEIPSDVTEVPGRTEASSEVVEREALWSALRLIPPRQRAVLVLRYYEDLREAEIAEILGRTGSTVRSLQSRALQTLKSRLASDEGAAMRKGGPGEA
jgi:RNA polymerase sigma-70 factor (ECF subfamily)